MLPMAAPGNDLADLAELAELAELAVDLAVEAGRRAQQWRRSGFSVQAKSSPTDLVTEVDRGIERWIAGELRRRRPGDSVLGEEGTSDTSGGAISWLIDPIDGTVNFTLGLPQYGVSVAAARDGIVVAGCVVNPASGDVFRAMIGGGAYLHRHGRENEAVRLAGPREVTLDRAVVSTGFGYDAARRARQGQVVARLLPRIADVRRAGAASLDLCAVAAGWLDAHYEAGLNSWDYAAGLLIAAESGCVSSGLRGRPAGDRFCGVAGPGLGPKLFELLTELDADGVLG
jgi:myo-inositol-1(or 4)-monophosphatase